MEQKKVWIVTEHELCSDGAWSEVQHWHTTSEAKAHAIVERELAAYKRDYPDGNASEHISGEAWFFTWKDGTVRLFDIHTEPLY